MIYDSISLQPIAGARVQLIDIARNAEVDDACLGASKSGQLTAANGEYEFFLNAADPNCRSSAGFRINVIPPPSYTFISTNIVPQSQPLDQQNCTSGGVNVDANTQTPDVCDIQLQAMAPTTTNTAATDYYLQFLIPAGAQDAIHNHIPLDPIRPLVNPDTYTIVAGELLTATVVANDQINPFGSFYGQFRARH